MANQTKIGLTKVAQFRGHKDAIYDFVWDQKREKLYSTGADGYVVEWNLNNPEEGKVVLRNAEAFYSIDLQDDVLRAGSRSGEIFALDLQHNTLLSRSRFHRGGVFLLSGTVSGGEDGVLIYNGTRKQLSEDSLRCIEHLPFGYAVGSSDGVIYLLDHDFEVVGELRGHTNSVFALERIDDHHLLSTGRDAHIKAWDLTITKEVSDVSAHLYQAKSLSYNGQHVLSSSMDKTIKLWTPDLKLLKVIDHARYASHTNCVNKVLWVGEDMFVSCSDDRSLILWRIEIKS